MKHKIKIITNLEPSEQEVEVKKLFTHMGFEFAYVMKPYTYRNSDGVHLTRCIVEVTTGMAANLLLNSSSKTMKGYIEDFKKWMDINMTPTVMQAALDECLKINSNIKL